MKKAIPFKMRTISIVSALCAALTFSAVSNAYHFGESRDSVKQEQKMHRHGGINIKKMVKVLELSEQQQTAIKAIKTQAKEQRKTMRATMKEFKTAAKTLIQADTFDEEAFSALQNSYQANFEQAGLERAKTRNAIFNVLSDEQQEKWEKVMERRKAKFKKSRGL